MKNHFEVKSFDAKINGIEACIGFFQASFNLIL